jgi:hypothetical protein
MANLIALTAIVVAAGMLSCAGIMLALVVCRMLF